VVAGDLEGLGAVGGRGDVEPGVAQRGREQLTDVGLVLDDEEPGSGVDVVMAVILTAGPWRRLTLCWEVAGSGG
jgi:hypothetical protein